METNRVENIFKITANTDIKETLSAHKPTRETENISELLSGNNAKSSILKVLNIISIGSLIFFFTPPGRRFISNTFSNIMKASNVKRMQKVLKNMPTFTEISFKKSSNIQELKAMARKLGIKIDTKCIEGIQDIDKFNTIISVLTDAHNKSKGRIQLPKKVSLHLLSCEGLSSRAGHIKLNKNLNGKALEYALCHELGHINHYGRTNVDIIDTPMNALRWGFDTSKTMAFAEDTSLIADITSNMGWYATMSPCEFVAETFAKSLGGVSIPKGILKKYAQYKGMPRLPIIRNFREG